MTRVKICGITNPFDARLAVHAGADAIGVIFAESPRRVSVGTAREIVEVIPPLVDVVALFMDAPARDVRDICSQLAIRTIQLHGFESPEYIRELSRDFRIIKACSLQAGEDLALIDPYGADAYLIDSRRPTGAGGTGRTCNWELAATAAERHIVVLAGGLGSDNVAQAIRVVRPFAVDCSSRLEERPGRKDPEKIRRFVEEVRRVDAERLAPPDEDTPSES